MAETGEFMLFGPPSTAGSSNTLTLSSNSSGPGLRGVAAPLVSRTLFSSPTPFVASDGREDQDDEMRGLKQARIVYGDALPNLTIKGQPANVREKSPNWNIDLALGVVRERVANLISSRRRTLVSQQTQEPSQKDDRSRFSSTPFKRTSSR